MNITRQEMRVRVLQHMLSYRAKHCTVPESHPGPWCRPAIAPPPRCRGYGLRPKDTRARRTAEPRTRPEDLQPQRTTVTEGVGRPPEMLNARRKVRLDEPRVMPPEPSRSAAEGTPGTQGGEERDVGSQGHGSMDITLTSEAKGVSSPGTFRENLGSSSKGILEE